MVNYFAFAYKNSKKRGIRSWLTLLGIFIGITAVISLITVGNGLKEAVNSQFGASATEVISVQAGGLNYGSPGSAVVNPLTRDDAERIDKLSTVEYAIPRNIELLNTEYNRILSIKYSVSVIEGFEDKIYEMMDLEAETGRLLQGGSSKQIVIGNNLATKTKNGFEKNIRTGDKILIEGKKFQVVGILERQGSFITDNMILMYDDDLNEIANYEEDVDIIGVKVKSKDDMDRAKEDIEKLLRKTRDVDKGEEDFEVSTPESSLESINSILNAIQIFVIIIASISIVVGAIGIINTMTTAVLERKKEIGIMKSIGARNSQIFMQFFVESGFMGLIGGILGIIFGLIVGSFGIMAINEFVGADTEPMIDISLILFSLLGSFLIGSIAGILPAMNAARQNPVEALRG